MFFSVPQGGVSVPRNPEVHSGSTSQGVDLRCVHCGRLELLTRRQCHGSPATQARFTGNFFCFTVLNKTPQHHLYDCAGVSMVPQKQRMKLLYRACDLFQSLRLGSFFQQFATGIGESASAAASDSVRGKHVLEFLAYYPGTKNLSQAGDRILDQSDSARNSRVFRTQNSQLLLNPLHNTLNILKGDV